MSDSQAHVPMRSITKAPGYHWCGYYDKLHRRRGARSLKPRWCRCR